MASTGCSRRYFFRNLTEGRIQKHRGSGTKTLALSQRERRIRGDLCPTALMGLTAPEDAEAVFPPFAVPDPGAVRLWGFPFLLPVRALNMAYGSRMGRLIISVSGSYVLEQ